MPIKGSVLDKISGSYAAIYWATVLFNVLASAAHVGYATASERGTDLACLLRRHHRHVVRALHDRRDELHRTHLPSAWGDYHPTIWDWLTLAGTVGLFASGILLAVRFLPVISMFEMRALIQYHSQEGERE